MSVTFLSAPVEKFDRSFCQFILLNHGFYGILTKCQKWPCLKDPPNRGRKRIANEFFLPFFLFPFSGKELSAKDKWHKLTPPPF